MASAHGSSDPRPFDVTVSASPPTRRQVVAPERSIGSGRYGALRDHNDKHRDDQPDQSTQHGSHALPKTKPWYATGAALVTAAALVLVAVSAVAVAALGGDGDKDAAIADATPSTSTGSAGASTAASPATTPAPTPSTATATPTATATAAPPTSTPLPPDPTASVTGRLRMVRPGDRGSCWYVDTPAGSWVFAPSAAYFTYSEYNFGTLNKQRTGIYPQGVDPAFGEGDPLFRLGDRLTVTGATTDARVLGTADCEPSDNGLVRGDSLSEP